MLSEPIDSASTPYPEWVRFSTEGEIRECSEWLKEKWTELGVLDASNRPADCFEMEERDREDFDRAWKGALRGRPSCMNLLPLGRSQEPCQCCFIPEFGNGGALDGVLIGIGPAEEAEGGDCDRDVLAEAVAKSSSATVVLDRCGRLVWANEAFTGLLGSGLEDLIDGPMVELLDPEAAETEQERLERLLAEESSFCQEIGFCTHGGGASRLRLEVNPLAEATSGRGLFVAHCYRIPSHREEVELSLDIIERARESLRSKGADTDAYGRAVDLMKTELSNLRKENGSKTEFLASVSHEIRTPMNAVVGFCDLLRSTNLSSEQRECVEAIHHGGRLLVELIGQVLDYSRMGSEHFELCDELLDLDQVLLEVGSIMSSKAREKGLEFIVNQTGLGSERVRGDATRIKQVLVNLLGNAFKFTNEGRVKMDISSGPASDGSLILIKGRVEDSGMGIEPDRLGLLFDPFFQGGSDGSFEYEGSGLGLTICKRLCRAMKGDVWVESTSKLGTVILFEIQLSKAMETDTREKKIKGKKPSGGLDSSEDPQGRDDSDGRKRRVLVVDDNPNNLLITSKLSEHLGYEAVTVRSGVSAIEELKSSDFQVVLMDVRMAPINGMETTEKIRSGQAGNRASDVYIIALTAHAMEGDRARCLEAGMNDYLSKPLTLEKLEETLKRAKDAS